MDSLSCSNCFFVMVANGTFSNTAKTAIDSGKSLIDGGKMICEAKEMVITELLNVAYDEASEEAKKILDKFRSGEKLSECDYFQLYNSLNKKHLRNWVLDESCNALICSGI